MKIKLARVGRNSLRIAPYELSLLSAYYVSLIRPTKSKKDTCSAAQYSCAFQGIYF